MVEMKAEQLKATRKAQALEGIALLAEAAKDLWSLLTQSIISYVLKGYFIFVIIILIGLFRWVGWKAVRV